MSLRFIPHKKPQLCCWRRPLMVRQPYSVAVWAPFLSPTRGTEGVVKTIERAVGTSLVPWGERLCKWAQWKFAFILPSAANLLHEKRGLGKAVEPSLMVKKDGWVFEKTLKVQGRTGRFSKKLIHTTLKTIEQNDNVGMFSICFAGNSAYTA